MKYLRSGCDRGEDEGRERRNNKNHTELQTRESHKLEDMKFPTSWRAGEGKEADGKLQENRKNNQTKLTLRRTKKFDIKIK